MTGSLIVLTGYVRSVFSPTSGGISSARIRSVTFLDPLNTRRMNGMALVQFNLTFDPEGGDMGRGSLVTAEEFDILVPHIGYILECLFLGKYSELPFRYGFEFNMREAREIQNHILAFYSKLPTHVEFYETNGKSIFEMRGISGGVSSSGICYLVTKHAN